MKQNVSTAIEDCPAFGKLRIDSGYVELVARTRDKILSMCALSM